MLLYHSLPNIVMMASGLLFSIIIDQPFGLKLSPGEHAPPPPQQTLCTEHCATVSFNFHLPNEHIRKLQLSEKDDLVELDGQDYFVLKIQADQ